MPIRTIIVGGRAWRVLPSGFSTANGNDEHGVLFIAGEGDAREVRVSRYSPRGERSRERALALLDDEYLEQLLAESQPSMTAPEAGYRKSPPGSPDTGPAGTTTGTPTGLASNAKRA